MAELGFMESLALGMIAGRSSSQLGDTTVGILTDLRHRTAIAQADAAYAALVDDYNDLVNSYENLVGRFNHVYKCAKEWMVEGEKRNQRIADANQSALLAEQRIATLEAQTQDLALKEAEARRDAVFYKERHRSVDAIASEDARNLREAREEIARLQAIIDDSPARGA